MGLAFLTVVLTNFVQVITLPIVPCMDNAIMSGYFVGDGTNTYGIRIEALDVSTNVIQVSWVEEKYIPPMSETAGIALSPDVVYIRCVVEGPYPEKTWKGGQFDLRLYEPPLHIKRDGNEIVMEWFDPYGCWVLQRKTKLGWVESPDRVPNVEMGIFRLHRDLIWRN
jgi:hypothetical protein